MNRIRPAIKLFLQFFKLGCFTFGGGWSIVAQMQQEFVEKQKLLTDQELLDITSVGRSLPGQMIANVSFLFGYHYGGILCGLACLLGIILPSTLLLTAITYLYINIDDNPYLHKMMYGVRAAVVPIIIQAVWTIRKGAFESSVCYIIFAVCLILTLFTSINMIALVIVGGVTGLLFSRWKGAHP